MIHYTQEQILGLSRNMGSAENRDGIKRALVNYLIKEDAKKLTLPGADVYSPLHDVHRDFAGAPQRNAAGTYFWLPLGLLIADKYDNERNIRSTTAPVLILHGEQDAVIPVEMGLRVYRAANEPKRIELFPQGAHDDLFDHGTWEKTWAFLASTGG
jgi:fermentation-respiration switch protein FrsA (DUF1100 family)